VQVVTNGLLTNYFKSGDGKTILLLHGWGDSSATFNKLSEQLGTNFQVLTLDLPGFGGTQRPEAVWDLDNYSEFIAEWLKKIGVSKLYGIVGHSNGGAIAINGLSSQKLSVQKLVLLASSGVRVPKKSLKVTAKVGKVATAPLPTDLKNKIRKRFYSGIGSEMLLFPEMEQTFRNLVGHDVLAEAEKINIPTLLIYGKNDKDTPPEYGSKFNTVIKNSELKVLPDAGHFVHHDQPEETNRLIMDFLRP